jgi:hypothetical protein
MTTDTQTEPLFPPNTEPGEAKASRFGVKLLRPGSRAERLSHPRTIDALKQIAADNGVCIRPVTMRRTDLATGETTLVDIPCGCTRESRCPACAKRAKRLRAEQCRQGWHRDDEPLPEPEASDEQQGLILLRADFEYARADCLARGLWHQVAELDAAIAEVDERIATSGLRGAAAPTKDGDKPAKRQRSTRRRQDAPNLPRRKMTSRTVGRTFVGINGTIYRPSTWLTLTLDSYGRVRDDGSPVDPTTYDYRRAAWDAIHFPALLDRFMQNLRRVEGWNVQYFGSIEPQKRLAPHAHFAIRGAIPRAVLKQVIAATYRQVWWPSTRNVVYDDQDPMPVWDKDSKSYVDPTSGVPLPTWDEALDQVGVDPDELPEHVVTFGRQADIKGVLGGTQEADKLIGYLTKYITKSVADCHSVETAGAEAHQRRMWEQLRYTPCSPRCANWLRYGIQPDHPRPKLRPGQCKGKAHQPDTLGIGGRRVLVSRNWSGKSLADHRWDQASWVRRLLSVALGHAVPAGMTEAQAVNAARDAELPAPVAWERALPGDPDLDDLPRRLMRSISTRIQHRAAIAAARAAQPPGDVSATVPAGAREEVAERG